MYSLRLLSKTLPIVPFYLVFENKEKGKTIMGKFLCTFASLHDKMKITGLQHYQIKLFFLSFKTIVGQYINYLIAIYSATKLTRGSEQGPL